MAKLNAVSEKLRYCD